MQKQFSLRARTLVLAAAIAFPACAPQKETIRRDTPRAQIIKKKPAAPAPQPKQDETDELIRDLKDTGKPPEYRIGIAKLFGDKGEKRAGPALAEALRSKLPALREAAVLAIGRVGYMPAWSDLLDIMGDASNKYLQWSAALSLGELKSRQSVGPIVGSLGSKDASTRSCAAFALGEIGSQKAVGALIEALNDRDPSVKTNAAKALGKLKNKDALPDLRKQRKHPNRLVRDAVNEAIKALEDG